MTFSDGIRLYKFPNPLADLRIGPFVVFVGLFVATCREALFEEEKLQQKFDKLSFSKAEDFTKLEKLFLITVHHLLERNPINLEETVLIISTTKGNVELLEKAENSISGRFWNCCAHAG